MIAQFSMQPANPIGNSIREMLGRLGSLENPVSKNFTQGGMETGMLNEEFPAFQPPVQQESLPVYAPPEMEEGYTPNPLPPQNEDLPAGFVPPEQESLPPTDIGASPFLSGEEPTAKGGEIAKEVADKTDWKIQQIPGKQVPNDFIAMRGKKVAHSNLFEVPSDRQGKGIGKEALYILENRARAKGAEYFVFTNILPNARGFYEKMGYTLEGGPQGIAYKNITVKPKGFSRSSYVTLSEDSKSFIKNSNTRINEIDEQLKVTPDNKDLKDERYILSLTRADLKKDLTSLSQAKEVVNNFYSKLSPKEGTAKGGEIVAYHGSPLADLGEISFGLGVRSNTFLGGTKEVKSGAIFFTPNKDVAQFFADNRVEFLKDMGKEGKATVYERMLNIKNPIDLTGKGIKKASKLLDKAGIDLEKEILGIEGFGRDLETLLDDKEITLDQLWQIVDKPENVAKLKKVGIDGAIFKETGDRGVSYAIFDPKQASKLSPKEGTK